MGLIEKLFGKNRQVEQTAAACPVPFILISNGQETALTSTDNVHFKPTDKGSATLFFRQSVKNPGQIDTVLSIIFTPCHATLNAAISIKSVDGENILQTSISPSILLKSDSGDTLLIKDTSVSLTKTGFSGFDSEGKPIEVQINRNLGAQMFCN